MSSHLLASILPHCAAVASTRHDHDDVALSVEEVTFLGDAVERRRREFMAGRACARQALELLGVRPVPVPGGGHGEPLWPLGVVGSITHCDGYRGCAVAWQRDLVSIGIDAEVDQPLPDGLWRDIAFRSERRLVEARVDAGVNVDRLIFSAKEAVYKAWFPLAERWLGFEDVEMTIDPANRTFRAQLLVPGPLVAGAPLNEFRGHWNVRDGIIATGVAVVANRFMTPVGAMEFQSR